jgi:V8-like Glu-specific endopeptidase
MRIVAVLIALMLAALPVRAEQLRRLDTAGEIFGLEAVGRLDIAAAERGTDRFCTATLIAPRRVLTAAHCVVGADGRPIAPEAMVFRPGLRDGRDRGARGVRRMAIHPGYDPDAAIGLARVAFDVALLELDSSVDSWAVPPLRAEGELARGQQVQVVSYARGRERAPSHEAACSVLMRAGRVLGLDCQATFGASGSPVFVSTPNGPRVVAVISSGGSVGGRDVTYAAALDGALPLLDAALPSSATPARLATPGAKTLRAGERAGAGGSILFHRPGG